MKKMLSVLTIGVMFFAAVTANAMNKAELVNALAEKSGLDKKQAAEAVNIMLAEINAAVAAR